MFNDQKHRVQHLDYGGGNGLLSEALAQQGWESSSYDPFPSNGMAVDKLGKFNFITAFEVFEHVPDIDRLMANLLRRRLSRC
jgi:2-polyprenyl-3-methyl-5-hydroxy-6-metoxy-1,4-benzoquinol methylase